MQYLTCTRLDISYIFNKLSQLFVSPKQTHWQTCKKVLRYLCGSIYRGGSNQLPLSNVNSALETYHSYYQLEHGYNGPAHIKDQVEDRRRLKKSEAALCKLQNSVRNQMQFKENQEVLQHQLKLKEERQEGSLSHLSTSVGEVANLLQRSRKEASVVEVEAEAEDEVEAVVMDEVGILTAATSTTTRKEKAQQEAVEEAIQTRGTINLKEEPSLTIEVRVSSSSAIPLIRKVTSYTTRTTKSL
ncbi:hypothetical protein ACOSQ3_020589 [Xanthoceras sorbifolium]